jgi:murein DD-endopeptidase MepM/ murein hydrolase activator NlpD
MSEGFIVQVLRPAGAAICRLHLRRRHFVMFGALLALALGGLYGLHVYGLRAAAKAVARLQAQRSEQQREIDAMERQTQALQRQTIESERSIERIERTLGTPNDGRRTKTARVHTATLRPPVHADDALALRLASLSVVSEQTQAQAQRLTGLASRVLNLRRLASIARARTLAAIPSLNPVGGGVNAAFGWRTDPFPEFHKGLDLAADYGTIVHAAAAGTVASAGWEGGFGKKVDIDHGNGYHTWYCHLSRITVSAGQRVFKGEPIAAAGSTGESTGPHLHYQVMHDGVAIDPMPFLNGVPANILATLPANPDVQ